MTLETLAALLVFACLRYSPVLAIPAMSPLSCAPGMVRMVLLLSLSWLTVCATPAGTDLAAVVSNPVSLLLACGSELLIGLTFGLAILLPQAGLGFAARLADMQAGLSAATLFNPSGQNEPESMLGTLLMLAATVLFFTLDLHLLLFQMLTASAQALPLGGGGIHLDPDGFFAMVGASFLLGLAVLAPVILGLFVVDIAVAYATRSMPQANVYFLALPLKVAMALLLLALTLALAPALIGRLFQDAFARLPVVFGG
jgi:flagellar biosynthetic protein FliR